jgi:hypothetical protein
MKNFRFDLQLFEGMEISHREFGRIRRNCFVSGLATGVLLGAGIGFFLRAWLL